ncbi:hypothetical protein MP228_009112 [Amoeboaphelidium protococcarum]|nr:hypothetical protein MP228_009112 [Amoeboaphelidium protococcarum]
MKTCWICFVTEEETPATVRWVSPCKCKGDTQWAHERCLLMWITRLQVQKQDEGEEVPTLIVHQNRTSLSQDGLEGDIVSDSIQGDVRDIPSIWQEQNQQQGNWTAQDGQAAMQQRRQSLIERLTSFILEVEVEGFEDDIAVDENGVPLNDFDNNSNDDNNNNARPNAQSRQQQNKNIIKCPQCHTPYVVVLQRQNAVSELMMRCYLSTQQTVDWCVPYLAVGCGFYVILLASAQYGSHVVTSLCGREDVLSKAIHQKSSWPWRLWVSLSSIPTMLLMFKSERLERSMSNLGLATLTYGFLSLMLKDYVIKTFQNAGYTVQETSNYNLLWPLSTTLTIMKGRDNLVLPSGTAETPLITSSIRWRGALLLSLLSLKRVYSLVYKKYMVPLILGIPIRKSSSIRNSNDEQGDRSRRSRGEEVPIFDSHHEDYELVNELSGGNGGGDFDDVGEYDGDADFTATINLHTGDGGDDLNGDARRGTSIVRSFTLFSLVKYVAQSWSLPFIASSCGVIAKMLVRGVFKVTQKTKISVGKDINNSQLSNFEQRLDRVDTFVWSIIGGCAFTLVKDVIGLLYKRQKRRQRLNMHLLNYMTK